MKSFHHFFISILLITVVFTSLIYAGCKNKCGSTVCQNGGTCTSDKCVCPEGYSGTACQIGWSDAAIGTYTCTNNGCTPHVAAVTPWQSVITKDGTNGGYTIDISNFDNSNVSVIAIVDSAVDSVQKITVGTTGSGIEGTGTVRVTNSSTTININFTTYNGVAGSECSMTMIKE